MIRSHSNLHMQPADLRPSGWPAKAEQAKTAALDHPALTPNVMQRFGVLFAATYLYVTSSLLDEVLSVHMGIDLHVNTPSGLATLICALASGAILAAFRTRVGKTWFALLVWTFACVPFSAWRSNSLDYAVSIVPYFMTVYAFPALAISPGQIRTLLWGVCLGNLSLAGFALVFGSVEDRLVLPETSMGNPNELALALCMGIALTLFLCWHPSRLIRALGLLATPLYLGLLFRTASRGSMVALVGTLVVLLCTIRGRWRFYTLIALVMVAIPLAAFTPKRTLERIALVFSDEQQVEVSPDSSNEDDSLAAARDSATARKELARRAAVLTLEHPIFGIGPGQFAQVLYEEGLAEGAHLAAQRPHNAYLQVSSEFGVPGLVFYVASLAFAIGLNYRTLQKARDVKHDRLIAAQSIGLFAYTLAFAFNTVFIHLHSIDNVAKILALSLANALAAERAWRSNSVGAALPNPPRQPHYAVEGRI